jgi:hypothetical protein
LTQYGKSLVMEAECAEYLESMSPLLKGQMGLILSNWSDAGNLTDIAPSGKCTATNQTCTSSSAFKSINISTTGSTEDPKKEDQSTDGSSTDGSSTPDDSSTDGDSTPAEDTLVTEVAKSVELCGKDCTECEATY